MFGGIDDLYSLDFRVDHNFNDFERLTFSYNRDYENAPNGNDAQVFPTSPGGAYVQTSMVASAALVAPLATILINDNNSSTQSIDIPSNNLKQPYIQNWNASLGREIVKGVVVDLRYVGSKGTKLIQSVNINEVNIFENGILNAFQVTDAGGNSPLLNQIFLGLNVPQVGVVNGTTITGSQAVRQNTTLQAYLLNNNVGGFANFLAYSTFITGTRGGLLLNGHLPANFVVANPQFGTAALLGNFANSSYNSGQIEVNKRFQNGFQIQASYVRSKALGSYDGNTQNEESQFITLRNEHLSKQLMSFDFPNVWKISGIWELPFGNGKLLLGF